MCSATILAISLKLRRSNRCISATIQAYLNVEFPGRFQRCNTQASWLGRWAVAVMSLRLAGRLIIEIEIGKLAIFKAAPHCLRGASCAAWGKGLVSILPRFVL
jgi:hypothetical protein